MEAEGSIDGSETQEREILNVSLNQHFNQDELEVVHSQILADFVVEEKVEYSVEDEEQDKRGRDAEAEVVDGAAQEDVAFAFLLEVFRIREWIVASGSFFNIIFQLTLELF